MNWLDFINIVTNLSLSIQLEKETEKKYILFTQNGPRRIECVILKTDPKSDDQVDFETNYLSTVNGNMNILSVDVKKEVKTSAFTAKTLADGRKLFTRNIGKAFALTAGVNVIDFDIPYPQCKITGIEVINGEVGDKANLYILDDGLGTYSTIPNYPLNQFGIDVNVPKDFYSRQSNYDADLYYNMCISFVYTSMSDKTLYINYILHEVTSA